MKKVFPLFLLFAFPLMAQVGIGTGNPSPTALLDITSTNKGILIPRVSLSNVNLTSLDGTNNAIESLLIYNTNATVVGGSGVGFYFYNGSRWETLSNKANSSTFKTLLTEPDADLVETNTFTATSLPSNITNKNHTSSNIIVSGLSGNILNVNLIIDINHGYDADLEIFLTSPNGDIIELSTDNGGSGDNYKITTFTDAASTNITSGNAPFNGDFQPEGTTSTSNGNKTGTITTLAGFNNSSPNGTWVIDVYDDGWGDEGTLNSIILELDTPTTKWFFIDEISVIYKEGSVNVINSKYSADPTSNGGIVTALVRSTSSTASGTIVSTLNNVLDYSSASPFYGTKEGDPSSNYWVNTTNMCYDTNLTNGTTYYYQLWRKGIIEASNENYVLIPMQIKK